MTGTNTKLTTAVETYFADLGRVRASGGATGERSSYGPLANLLNAVGATLRPKVFCVGELADQGAGHPDFGLLREPGDVSLMVVDEAWDHPAVMFGRAGPATRKRPRPHEPHQEAHKKEAVCRLEGLLS